MLRLRVPSGVRTSARALHGASTVSVSTRGRHTAHHHVALTLAPSAQCRFHSQLRNVRVLASSDDSNMNALMETAALDDLIDQMLSATSQQQLARMVAENIVAIDTKFWIRIATRNDTAQTQADKDKLQSLANTIMVLVDAVVKRTEAQLQGGSKVLQDILTAAADEKGEWYLPLTQEQVKRVRAALDRYESQLDEAMLSNAFAWIKKCSEDRFDSMVTLIQKVLQLYAARQLATKEESGVEGALNKVIYAEEADWAALIRQQAQAGAITEATFMEALQKRMEGVVLGLTSGSYAQRVQAEYLKEVESRAKSTFRELAAAPVSNNTQQ